MDQVNEINYINNGMNANDCGTLIAMEQSNGQNYVPDPSNAAMNSVADEREIVNNYANPVLDIQNNSTCQNNNIVNVNYYIDEMSTPIGNNHNHNNNAYLNHGQLYNNLNQPMNYPPNYDAQPITDSSINDQSSVNIIASSMNNFIVQNVEGYPHDQIYSTNGIINNENTYYSSSNGATTTTTSVFPMMNQVINDDSVTYQNLEPINNNGDTTYTNDSYGNTNPPIDRNYLNDDRMIISQSISTSPQKRKESSKIKNYSGKLIYNLNNDTESSDGVNGDAPSGSGSRASSARKAISFFVSADGEMNHTEGTHDPDSIQERPESAKQIKKKEIILKRLEMSRRANSARSESRLKSTKPSPSSNISTKDKKKEKKSGDTSKEKSVIKNSKESGNDRVLKKEEEITEDIPTTKPTEVSTNAVTEDITDSTLATTTPTMTTTTTTTTGEPSISEPPTTMKSLQPSAPSVKLDSNHHIKSNIHMRKFKLPNNKNLMKNALNTILAGKINEKVRQEAIQTLDQSDQNHFIILFQNNEQHSFRGLYSFNPENEQAVHRIFSVNGNKSNTANSLLPEVIQPSDVYEYYKYDTGSRSFYKVHTKSFQRTTHACALIPSYFKRGNHKSKN